VCAGRVAETLPWGERERRFRGRRDAVYRERADGSFERLRPDYHPDDLRRDTGAGVPVFDPDASWYFGDQAPLLPCRLQRLAAEGRPTRIDGPS